MVTKTYLCDSSDGSDSCDSSESSDTSDTSDSSDSSENRYSSDWSDNNNIWEQTIFLFFFIFTKMILWQKNVQDNLCDNFLCVTKNTIVATTKIVTKIINIKKSVVIQKDKWTKKN